MGIFQFLNDYMLIIVIFSLVGMILIPILIYIVAPVLIGFLEVVRLLLFGIQYMFGELAEHGEVMFI